MAPDTAALDPALGVAAVLAAARRARSEADRAEVVVLTQALAWADLHAVTDPDDAATWGDTPVPIAGPGAPLVGEFCVAEFAAALRMSSDSGRFLIAHAVELGYRLPRVWARVQCGDLQVWRARRIADKTVSLSAEAAAWVDHEVAGFAHKIGPAQTERLVDAAIARFMPERAAEIARSAADGRFVTIDHHDQSFTGTATMRGELDLADALDLDARLSAEAASLKDWGSEDSLDVRRAAALGNLARGEALLPAPADLAPPVEEGVQRPSRNPAPTPPRPITLYLHLDPRDPFGRVDNRGPHLISVEQIREWIQAPDADVTVRPVIDLSDEITCTGYAPSDLLREQVILRDRTCVFPWCNRNARACDLDHVVPFDPDGPQDQTRSSNLAALCRRHHRLKTHGGWTYDVLDPGAYRWRSPRGLTYLRDQTGTRELTPRPVDPPG